MQLKLLNHALFVLSWTNIWIHKYLYILLLLWTITILPQEEANQIVHQGNHSTNMKEAGGWHKRGGGLRNNVGLGFKPVYYTDGAADFKALSRYLGKLFKASVNI